MDRGRIEFRVFFPTGPDPEIDAIRVAGDFQQALGDNNWDFAGGLPLTQDTSDPRGSFWTAQTNSDARPSVPSAALACWNQQRQCAGD